MSILSAYKHQLASNAPLQDRMDAVAGAFLEAPNYESGIADPYWFAMYGGIPGQSEKATAAQALLPRIIAPTGEPLLVIKGDYKFVPQVLTPVEQNQDETATDAYAYIIKHDGRKRGVHGLAGLVGLHSYYVNPAGSLAANTHALLYSHRHLTSHGTMTERIVTHHTVHIGEAAIEQAIHESLSERKNPRPADQVIEQFFAKLSLLHTAIENHPSDEPLRHQ